MSKPVRRAGFFGTIPKNPHLALYATFLSADTPLTVYFRHESDGYQENRPFSIRSIERREYPNPHLVRGTLEVDLNRPGQDAGDWPTTVDVVIELWFYPETLVYVASEYIPIPWFTFDDLQVGSIFKCTEYNKVST